MQKILPILLLLFVIGCSKKSNPTGSNYKVRQSGKASYYADKFDGKRTASGEYFDQLKYTAAHRTIPFGTKVLVKNTKNGKTVWVRINDRGPFSGGRIIDLSKAAAKKIDLIQAGVAEVQLSY